MYRISPTYAYRMERDYHDKHHNDFVTKWTQTLQKEVHDIFAFICILFPKCLSRLILQYLSKKVFFAFWEYDNVIVLTPEGAMTLWMSVGAPGYLFHQHTRGIHSIHKQAPLSMCFHSIYVSYFSVVEDLNNNQSKKQSLLRSLAQRVYSAHIIPRIKKDADVQNENIEIEHFMGEILKKIDFQTANWHASGIKHDHLTIYSFHFSCGKKARCCNRSLEPLFDNKY
jgi:hypothetical protein